MYFVNNKQRINSVFYSSNQHFLHNIYRRDICRKLEQFTQFIQSNWLKCWTKQQFTWRLHHLRHFIQNVGNTSFYIYNTCIIYNHIGCLTCCVPLIYTWYMIANIRCQHDSIPLSRFSIFEMMSWDLQFIATDLLEHWISDIALVRFPLIQLSLNLVVMLKTWFNKSALWQRKKKRGASLCDSYLSLSCSLNANRLLNRSSKCWSQVHHSNKRNWCL